MTGKTDHNTMTVVPFGRPDVGLVPSLLYLLPGLYTFGAHHCHGLGSLPISVLLWGEPEDHHFRLMAESRAGTWERSCTK